MSHVSSTMTRPGQTTGLPSSLASSTSITSTLTASSSTQSLAPTAPVSRLRSNSNLSAPPPTSPTDSRHAGPQARAQAQGLPVSPRVDHVVSSTPPPRPPRGPLRSPGAPRSPNVPSVVSGSEGSQALLRKALETSRDGGETLDLSRERLERIGEEEVEFFRQRVGRERKGVWRLALSYNHLRDNSIAPSFATLHRLRYLNLKGNQLTVVPPALLNLSSLEILDLSKNQIVAFPEAPGRLAHLKVLSLSNNRLTALPTYLVTFNNLKVFKADNNPINWPPRNILGPLVETEGHSRSRQASLERDQGSGRSEDDLRPWIQGMKIWLQEQLDERTLVDDAVQEDIATITLPKWDAADGEKQTKSSMPWGATASGTSQLSTTMKKINSIPEEVDQLDSPVAKSEGGGYETSSTVVAPTIVATDDLPPPPSLTSISHRHRGSASNSSTPVSASTSSSHSGQIPPAPPPFPPPPPHSAASGHNRGASYTVTQRLSGGLTAKKSLPDLRQSHAKIIEERRGEAADKVRPLGFGIEKHPNWQGKLQQPIEIDKPPARTLQKMGSLEVLKLKKTAANEMVDSRTTEEAPAIDESRNSYFRRVSMLPASSISKAVSPAMLMFVDATRGLLFALTQLHTALKQYLNFAVPDRVAGVFARVLEPAPGYITSLINALDRFDSTSRRSAPPVNAVRGVVDAAKESIAVFGKIVAALRLQSPAFKDADVRYTRLLLLHIHGAVAEISCAWKTIVPLLAEIRPLLTPDGMRLTAPMMIKSSSAAGLAGRTISPILERGESTDRAPSRSTAAALAAPPMPPVGSSPRSKSRRHAGSFSALDVERGMMMGTPDVVPRQEWPDMSRPILEGAEGASLPPFPLHAEPEPPADSAPPPPMVTSYSQPPRSRHVQTSSAGSSYLSAPNGSHRNLSFDVRPPTPASATLFDDDLLDVIETATDIAFTVWLRLAEDIGASAAPYQHAKSGSVSSTSSGRLGLALMPHDSRRPTTIPFREYHDLVAALSTAEHVTTTLRETLMGLRANPFAFAHSSLPDNAQAFIKTVVRVSGLIKSLSVSHTFGISVRQSLSKLTQATRECAILIQVSSLRPTQSTPALVHPPTDKDYTPMSASNEDLGQPFSGLRGLHLPARQALRSRNQSNSSAANGSPPIPELSRFERLDPPTRA